MQSLRVCLYSLAVLMLAVLMLAVLMLAVLMRQQGQQIDILNGTGSRHSEKTAITFVSGVVKT